MHASSSTHADQLPPPRLRPWAAAAISASIIAVYSVILLFPMTGSDRQRAQLHATVASLGAVIQAVESSYADGDLDPSGRHLRLPASTTFCSQLRLQQPETGHARVSCELRADERVRGTLQLQRSPQGAWHCDADVSDPLLLPAACSAATFN